MGTSKGYIAPSTPQWSYAKRGITSYLKNSTDEKKKVAAAGYAKAMLTSGFATSRATQAFSGIASFAASSNSDGIKEALKEIGREDILALPPDEALNALILDFTNDGATIDDGVTIDCISDALKVLEIESLENFSQIDTRQLIGEFVCQFAKHKFAQLFDKQIRNRFPNTEEANAKISEMQEYIYYTMKQNLSPEILSEINPHNLTNELIIQQTMQRGFEMLEKFYGE